MKTLIFEDYWKFVNREDKSVNGVSPEFTGNHPNYEQDNESNEGCWNCSGCSDCSDCSGCSDCSDCSDCSGCSRCSDCSDCSGCSGCSGCSRCSDCSGCSRCSDCSGCSRCSDCSDLKNAAPIQSDKPAFEVPIIENIHQKVLEVVSVPSNSLDMSSWHTCETTHCRAGWVVTLAGTEGKELERRTSTEFAALQIYHKSSEIKVAPTQFYKLDEVAMQDIKRCAELEKAAEAAKIEN